MTKVYTIEQAYSMNSKGRDYKDGWHTKCNGEWGNTYRYKSEAVAAFIAEGFKMDPKTKTWYDPKETITVKNLMTGEPVTIPADTPWCCNPASETYWSM